MCYLNQRILQITHGVKCWLQFALLRFFFVETLFPTISFSHIFSTGLNDWTIERHSNKKWREAKHQKFLFLLVWSDGPKRRDVVVMSDKAFFTFLSTFSEKIYILCSTIFAIAKEGKQERKEPSILLGWNGEIFYRIFPPNFSSVQHYFLFIRSWVILMYLATTTFHTSVIASVIYIYGD